MDTNSKPDYFWTCFGWADYHPNTLHMTHKFLGQLCLDKAKILEIICNDYFSDTRVRMMPVLFSTPDYFGAKYERVLKCKSDSKKYFCLDLRMALDVLKKDDFEHWSPHVTTKDKSSISARITHYYIMKNKEILKAYELN